MEDTRTKTVTVPMDVLCRFIRRGNKYGFTMTITGEDEDDDENQSIDVDVEYEVEDKKRFHALTDLIDDYEDEDEEEEEED
jgi:hypothetical protein